MKKTNLKNAYDILAAFLALEAAKWPDSNHAESIKKILQKAEDTRKG